MHAPRHGSATGGLHNTLEFSGPQPGGGGGDLAISGGGGGGEQLSKTIQHLFGLKIHLIYNYKASDSLNFHEIKFN